MSKSLDSGETPSYLSSHPDPSCFAYGNIVVLGGLRVYSDSKEVSGLNLLQKAWLIRLIQRLVTGLLLPYIQTTQSNDTIHVEVQSHVTGLLHTS